MARAFHFKGVETMESLRNLDAQIAALQAQRMQLIVDANAESKKALAAIVRGFEWRVTSDGIGQYQVACRYDEQTLAALAAWKEHYPHSSESAFSHSRGDKPDAWIGMKYTIARSSDGVPFILASGGGHVVLTLNAGWHGPYELTEDQFATFIMGTVPLELRKPW